MLSTSLDVRVALLKGSWWSYIGFLELQILNNTFAKAVAARQSFSLGGAGARVPYQGMLLEGISPQQLGCRPSQRAQYPLIKEYTFNHNIKAPII